jgi:hypothetical protein
VVFAFFSSLPLSRVGADTVSFQVTAETVTIGTSTGFANEAGLDGSVNVKTEAATSAPPLTRMMIPNGDVSVDWDYMGADLPTAKFYLRTAAASSYPTAGEKSTALPVGLFNQLGGTSEQKSLSKSKGASQASLTLPSVTSTAHQDGYIGRFSSPALIAQTIGAGTWTLAVATAESDAKANSYTILSVYVWRPGTSSVVSYVYDSDTALGVEWGTTEDGQVLTFAGAAVTAALNDYLVLEFWQHAAQAQASTYNQVLYYDGTADVTDATTTNAASFLQAPNAITLTTDGNCGTPTPSHTGCLIGNMWQGEPNANASYIAGSVDGDGGDTDTFSTLSPSLAAGSVVTNMRLFAWFRDNHTNGAGGELRFLLEPHGIGAHALCSEGPHQWIFVDGGRAYQNLSWDWPTCDSGAWTVGDVNALTFDLEIIVNLLADNAAVTYVGAVVSYTVPADYLLDFTSTFAGVDGDNPTMRYYCTTTDEEQILTVTYGGMTQGTVTCDGIVRTFSMSGNGNLQAELSSVTIVGDTTQSTYTFDYLVVTAERVIHGTGDPLTLRCSPGLTSWSCSVTLDPSIIGIYLNVTLWYADGEYKGTGAGNNNTRVITFDKFIFPSGNVSVKVIAYLTNGQVLQVQGLWHVDNSWLFVVVLFVVLAMVIVLAWFVHRKNERNKPRVRVERDPHAEARMRIVEGTRR